VDINQSDLETSNRLELVMKIGSIGAGNVGGALAKLWRAAGHDVRAGGHDSVADVAAHGDIVLLAVPADAVDSALQAAGSLDGKVLIDATNDLSSEWPSLATHIAELAPGAKVVKAFNAFFAPIFENAAQLQPPANLVFCGDDKGAKETVAGLIRDVGLEPVDVGGLDQAANVEAFARMNVNLGFGQGRGLLVYRYDTP
jgi:predicted dinucleotide-binding enzyme